jgi:hypothetical protein
MYDDEIITQDEIDAQILSDLLHKFVDMIPKENFGRDHDGRVFVAVTPDMLNDFACMVWTRHPGFDAARR